MATSDVSTAIVRAIGSLKNDVLKNDVLPPAPPPAQGSLYRAVDPANAEGLRTRVFDVATSPQPKMATALGAFVQSHPIEHHGHLVNALIQHRTRTTGADPVENTRAGHADDLAARLIATELKNNLVIHHPDGGVSVHEPLTGKAGRQPVHITHHVDADGHHTYEPGAPARTRPAPSHEGLLHSGEPQGPLHMPAAQHVSVTSLDGVRADVPLSGLDTSTGRPVSFRTSEVQINPLRDNNNRVVGATFWSGGEALRDENWVNSQRAQMWPANTFFVSGPSNAQAVGMWLADGRMVSLDGAGLARLLNDVEFFRSAVDANRPPTFGLLMSEASAMDGQGGLAADFQATLATNFGYRQSAIGPSQLMDRAALDGFAAHDGGPWRELNVSSVINDVVLSGRDRRGALVRFRSSQIDFTPIEYRGSVIGAVFLDGPLRDHDVRWGSREQADYSLLKRAADDPRGPGSPDVVPTPWSKNTFYIATHGSPQQNANVHLVDGTALHVDGATLASLLGDLVFFHKAMERNQAEALTMIICFAAQVAGPGGLAHDFQSTLAWQFGYQQPVHATTHEVATAPYEDGTSGTIVENGGVWRRFPADRVQSGGLARDPFGTSGLPADPFGSRDPFDTSGLPDSDDLFDPAGLPDLDDLLGPGSPRGVEDAPGAANLPELDDLFDQVGALGLDDPVGSGAARGAGDGFDPANLPDEDDLFGTSPVRDAGGRSDGLNLPDEDDLFGASPARGAGDGFDPANLPDEDDLFGEAPLRDAGDRFDGLNLPDEDDLFHTTRGESSLPLSGDTGLDSGQHLHSRPAPDPSAASAGHPSDTSLAHSGETRSLSLAPTTQHVTVASLGGVIADVPLSGFDTETGRPVGFQASDVRISPLVSGNRVVGATFWSGGEAVRDENWVNSERAQSWPANTFFVSGPSNAQAVGVWLADGRMVSIDGVNLARMLNDVQFFRSAVDVNQPPTFGLLMSEASAVDGQGGLAAEFQATLANEFGYRQSAIGPSQVMDRAALDGFAAHDGGPWRELHVRPVISDILLAGIDRNGVPVTFRSSEVLVTPMAHRGSVIGAIFLEGRERNFQLKWGSRDKDEYSLLERADDDPRGPGDPDVIPTPWPQNSFYVTTHGTPQQSATVNLVDGNLVHIDGASFARLVGDIAFFHNAMSRNQAEALSLLVCYSARDNGPGGLAHDFQATMAWQFGYSQPVHGATEQIFAHLREDGTSGTNVVKGGVWRQFPIRNPRPDALPADPFGSEGLRESDDHSRLSDSDDLFDPAGLVDLDDLLGPQGGDVRRSVDDSADPVDLPDLDDLIGRVDGLDLDRRAGSEDAADPVNLPDEDDLFGGAPARDAGDRADGLDLPDEDDLFAPADTRDDLNLPDEDDLFASFGAHTWLSHSGGAGLDGGQRLALGHPDAPVLGDRFETALAQAEPVRLTGADLLAVPGNGDLARTLHATFQETADRAGSSRGDWSGGQSRMLSAKRLGALISHRTDTVANVEIAGHDPARGPVRFASSDVRVRPLVSDGKTVGVTFNVDAGREHDLRTVKPPYSGITEYHSQAGDPALTEDVAPFPRDTFFVAAGTDSGRVEVHLAGRGVVHLDGRNLATLVNDLRDFQQASRGAGAVALIVRDAGQRDEAGGTAHDFQRTLAEFNSRLPVVASTTDVVLTSHAETETWRTSVRGGGQWRLFSSGPADVLALDTRAGQWIRAGVSSLDRTPLTHGRDIVGVTFRSGDGRTEAVAWAKSDGHRDPGSPWPADTFFVDVATGPDGRFQVRGDLGQQLRIEGRALARVVIASTLFQRARQDRAVVPLALFHDITGGGVPFDRSGFAPHAEVRFVGERPAVRSAEIDPADVRSTPLEHNGRTIGVSFETGQSLAKAQRWAQGDGKDITELLDTGRFNRATASGKRLRTSSPWSDNVFFVHGEGGRDHVELTLSDGRRVIADGARLAAALAASETFRRAVGGGELGHEIVLLAHHAGGRPVQGLGSDFQRALADSFGFDRPVLAPSKGLDLVHESGIRYSGTAVFDGGVWRTYPEAGTVLTGHTPDGQRIWFRGETLATTELTRGESVVGVSYRDEADPVARQWAEQERTADAETSWPQRSFFVDAPGDASHVTVLAAGRPVRLDGRQLATLVARSDQWLRAAADGHAESVVLLVSQSGDGHGPDGLAHDFHRVLAGQFGFRGRVHAPIAATRGEGGWRAVPADVVDGRELQGTDARTGRLMSFRSWEVRATEVRHGGRVLGLAFTVAGDRQVDLRLAGQTHTNQTGRFPQGIVTRAQRQRYPAEVLTSPWPNTSFLISTHGQATAVELNLRNGTQLAITGATFARVAHDLRAFRDALGSLRNDAITMLVCYAAALTDSGGIARDFQRVLGGLGYRQPVVAGSRTVYLNPDSRAGTWSTSMDDGGTWRSFSSGPAQVLVQDVETRQWRLTDPADVQARALHSQGKALGMTYRVDDPAAMGRLRSATNQVSSGLTAVFDTFLVDARLADDDRFIVRTGDDRFVSVDAGTLARVVATSPSFLRAMASPNRPGRFELLVDGRGSAGKRIFLHALQDFVDDRPVHEAPEIAPAARPSTGAGLVARSTAEGTEPGVSRSLEHDGRTADESTSDTVADDDSATVQKLRAWFDQADERSAAELTGRTDSGADVPPGDGHTVSHAPDADVTLDQTRTAGRRAWVPGENRLTAMRRRLGALMAHRADAVAGVEIIGHHETRGEVTFRSGDVRVRPLVSDGRTVGVTFKVDDARKQDRAAVREPYSGETEYHDAPGDAGRTERAPFPRDTFFVSATAAGDRVEVHLAGRGRVTLDGHNLATLVNDLRTFRGDGETASALALVVRDAGRRDEPGGTAHDFQRALDGFGHRAPVVAATGDVALRAGSGSWRTAVTAGQWRAFSSGSARVLGRDVYAREWHGVEVSDVDHAPLVRRGEPVGMTFRSGGERAAGSWQTPGSFAVDTPSTSDGHFQVRTAAGEHVLLDGRALSRVITASDLFQRAGGNRPLELFHDVHDHGITVDRSGFAAAGDLRVATAHPSARRLGFEPAEVLSAPLKHRGRTIGVTFQTGMGRTEAETWAGGDGKGFTDVLDPGEHSEFDAGDARRYLSSPWSEQAFFVHAGGTSGQVELTLRGGRKVTVDGAGLAGVLAESEPFRQADGEIVLLSSHAGEGVAHDFQRALADLFGVDRPVLAPSTGLELVHKRAGKYSTTTVHDGGTWRVFPELDVPVAGRTADGRNLWFRPDSVALTELTRGGDVVGVSLRGEADLAAWPQRSFIVDAPGGADHVVALVDGQPVRLDGRQLGSLVARSQQWRQAVADHNAESVVLLTSGSGRLADDFHQVLAQQFGYRGAVRFPAEGGWRQAPSHVVEGVELVGRDPRTGEQVPFRSWEARTAELRHEGRPIGVSFGVAQWRQLAVRVAEHSHEGVTYRFPEGAHSRIQAGSRQERFVAPWPDNSFLVSTHGTPAGLEVHLADGTRLWVSGATAGRLTHDLRVFRDVAGRDEADAIAMLVCWAGSAAQPGGLARDFQRVLGGLGYRQPVVAASREVVLRDNAERGTWDTSVVDGGFWRSFTSGPARVLAQDVETGQWRRLSPDEVRTRPLVVEGRTLGTTFRSADETAVVPDSARDAFLVDAQMQPDDRFVVRTNDNRAVQVDAGTLARLVAEVPAFHQAVSGAQRFELLADRPGSVGRRSFLSVLTDFAAGDRGAVDVVDPATRAHVETVAGYRHGDGAGTSGQDGVFGPSTGRPEPAEPAGPSTSDASPDVSLDGDPEVGRRLGAWLDEAENWSVGRLTGWTDSGEVRHFTADDVRVRPLTKRGRTVGLAFETGSDLKHTQRWAAAPRANQAVTKIRPDGPGGSQRVRSPWTEDGFFVSARGSADRFEVRLADGTRVTVDGRNFARIVGSLDAFRSTVAPDARTSVTLLTAGSGAGERGAAASFQQTLAGEFGHRQPVVAATADVRLKAPLIGRRGRVTLGSGGEWRVFSTPDADLLGLHEGTPRVFSSNEVATAPVRADGHTVGVSFRPEHTPEPLPAGQEGLPAKAFQVDTGVSGNRFEVTLADGRTVAVDGRTLARLTAESQPFRDAADAHHVQAVALPSGRDAGGFGAALTHLTRDDRPVVSPDPSGGWQLAGGRTPLSGVDSAGRVHWFAPADVRSRPLDADGRAVGVTFRDEPGAPVTITSSHGSVAHLDVDASATHFAVRLADGTEVTVDGGTLARTVAGSPLLHSADVIALPGAAGALDGRGAAHDFERALSEAAGRDVTVAAQDAAGRWRVLGDRADSVIGHDAHAGVPHLFTVGDVRANPLRQGDTTVGVSFHDDGPQQVRTETGVPVAVKSIPGWFEVDLADGRRVGLPGAEFATVVAGSELFRAALGNREGAITLLASGAGDPAGRGGAAHDFQSALAGRLGIERPVAAPAGPVDLKGFLGGGTPAETVPADPGWRTFPLERASGEPVRGWDSSLNWHTFDVGDVDAHSLVRDGRVVGVYFDSPGVLTVDDPAQRLAAARTWAEQADHGQVHFLPEGHESIADVEAAGLHSEPTRAPWPDDTFFVVTHTFNDRARGQGGFRARLHNGTEVFMQGNVFADLVQRTDAFQSRFRDGDSPESIALLACYAAQGRGHGVPALDFQQALANAFGHRQPVGAPDTSLGVGRHTTVADGGSWHTFSGGPADLLGWDVTGRPTLFSAADVRAKVLTEGDRRVAVSFSGESRPDSRTWPEGALGVEAAGIGDRFQVTLADGRTMTVEPSSLAKAMIHSRQYWDAAGTEMPTALALHSSVSDGAARRFEEALARDFGHTEPTLVRRGGHWETAIAEAERLAGTDADGRTRLFTSGEVQIHSAGHAGMSFTGQEVRSAGTDVPIAVDATADRFHAQLSDGSTVSLSGATLAELVARSGLVDPAQAERFVLRTSADATGIAADFQRALADRFVWWQPVAIGNLEFATLPQPMRGFGSAGVQKFQAGDVEMGVLRHHGRTIGVSFMPGQRRTIAGEWAAAPAGRESLVAPDGTTRAPWGEKTFFVDTFFFGIENSAIVRLGGEHMVELNATTFADLIHRSEPLRKALSDSDSVALLASGAGRVAGRGGFAHDFQRALAERFGGDRPVFATRGEVDLSVATDGSRALTSVSSAADWQRFGSESVTMGGVRPLPSVVTRNLGALFGRGGAKAVDRIMAEGRDVVTDEDVRFRSSQVRAYALEHGGRTIGVTFDVGPERRIQRDWARATDPALSDGARAPWARNTFFVAGHAEAGEVHLTLSSGQRVAVDGPTLAKVTRDLKLFRDTVARTGSDSLALLICDAAVVGRRAGLARDFEQALAGEFGTPVFAPTTQVRLSASGQTSVLGGGMWKAFSSAPDALLGTDVRTGGRRFVDAGEIQRRALVVDGREAGVSFRDESAVRSSADEFQVDVDATATHFGLRMADGAQVSVDGATFARVLGRAGLLPRTTALVLPDSRAGALAREGGAAHDFQHVLATEFGHGAPVVAGDGAGGRRVFPTTGDAGPARADAVTLAGGLRPEDVYWRPLEHDDRIIGVSIAHRSEVSWTQGWAVYPGRDQVFELPGGHERPESAQAAGQALIVHSAPWPENTFFVNLHSNGRDFGLFDLDDRPHTITGTQLAGLLTQLEPFRARFRGADAPEALALLACFSATTTRAEGAAHSFQTALASLGYQQPVLGATRKVWATPERHPQTGRYTAAVMAGTGNQWRGFSSGAAHVLGQDVTGAVHAFDPADVRSRAVTGDRVVGVSFVDSPATSPATSAVPQGAVAVHVRPGGDGFAVTLADGRPMTVDSRAFAAVLSASEAFREVTRHGEQPLLLLPAAVGDRAAEVRDALARSFGHTGRVELDSHGPAHQRLADVLIDQTGWEPDRYVTAGGGQRPAFAFDGDAVLPVPHDAVGVSFHSEESAVIDDGLPTLGSTSSLLRALVLQAIQLEVASTFGRDGCVVASALTGQPGQGDATEELERWLGQHTQQPGWRTTAPDAVPAEPVVLVAPGVTGHDSVNDSPQADDTPPARAKSLREFLNSEQGR
ncbi:hypothetical protein [Lentzea kentuckyensis]|uniref:hypothetical protein n=1 Tax=Lentzea kentuckyensis TaxID=360086 RepID=UPI001B809EBD|nr:hypothetical protein [Lentzea kentuckyensis]